MQNSTFLLHKKLRTLPCAHLKPFGSLLKVSPTMGCGVSKFDTANEGETSCLHTRSRLVHRAKDRAIADSYLLSKPTLSGRRGEDVKGDDLPRKVNMIEEKYVEQRENLEKEEDCIDNKESIEDLNDRDDGISFMQSPSFRIYCIPSQFDDGSEGGDSNPDETKDNQKVDQNENKGSSIRRDNQKFDVQNANKRSSVRAEKTNSLGKEKKSIKSRFARYLTF